MATRRSKPEVISIVGLGEILKAAGKARKEAFYAGYRAHEEAEISDPIVRDETVQGAYEEWLKQREEDFERYWNPGTVDVELPEDDYPGADHA